MSGLSPERQTTASAAPLIIHGSNVDVYQHWLVRTGQDEPDDLSRVFAVQWGKHNETFVLDWIEREQQIAITERQRWCPHPKLKGIGATLDGYRAFDDGVVDAKVLNPYAKAETDGLTRGFIEHYAPQVAVQIACRGCTRGYLAVQQGNYAPVLHEVPVDAAYIDDVLARLVEFQRCVDEMEPPVPTPKPPVMPEQWRTVDLDQPSPGENWVPAMRPTLDRWRATKDVWAEHEQARKDVKLLLPDDVGRATHDDILIRRAKNGAVTIVKQEIA